MPRDLSKIKLAVGSKGFVLEEKRVNTGKFEAVVGVISALAPPSELHPIFGFS